MKQITLAHALTDKPAAADFAMIEAARPTCPKGGVLIRLVYLSLDPYVGSRIRGRNMGEPVPTPMQDVIPGAGVGQVIESDADGIRSGDWVHTMEAGWREYADLQPGHFRKIDPDIAPLIAHIGVLGMPGLTGWAGITQLAKVNSDDTVLVDAAAGAVGGTVGQIAKIKGARVVGIAGGPDKCALVTDMYGFDACIDYKADGWKDALTAAVPEGVSVHFENVSIAMATEAMMRMRPYARSILCGLVDQYHADTPPPGLNAGLIIGKRAQVMGLVVYDFYPRWNEYVAEAAPWIEAGKLKIAQDRVEGLEAAPALFEKLMRGANAGKCVVAISPEKV